MEPCPPAPCGCQHCLGCLPCALTYELCDRTRRQQPEPYIPWWPASIDSPTLYYQLKRRAMAHQFREQSHGGFSDPSVWRCQASSAAAGCGSQLLAARGARQLAVRLPTARTNIAAADELEFVGVCSLPPAPLQQQAVQQPQLQQLQAPSPMEVLQQQQQPKQHPVVRPHARRGTPPLPPTAPVQQPVPQLHAQHLNLLASLQYQEQCHRQQLAASRFGTAGSDLTPPASHPVPALLLVTQAEHTMAAAVHQPPEHVVKGAHVDSLAKYKDMYARSLSDPEGFWGEFASQFHWNKKWSTGADFHKYNFDLNKGGISLSWFNGAETNVCYNCVDRHVKEGNGDRVAFFWEGNDVGQATTTTYKELQDMVCQIANYMKSQGVGKGDDVTIYMPMVPELPAVMLACARIGAVFSVVFAGFSAESLAGRISDSSPKMVVTCSAVKRGPKHIELKKIVDEALQILDNEEELHIPRVLVYDHKASGVSRDAIQASPVEGRDVWWQDVIGDQSTDCEVTWVGAEDPLFKLYTSGSTGKPKGVLHTTAGYMIGAAATFNYVFDYKPDDIFWCTADCGWITGHSYVTFGPLLMGAKQVLFEGVPTYPDAGRCWEVCDKYGVTLFYTAPTAIRTLMACGEQHVTKHKRTSLRILGTVGEPINPEAWRWYYEVVGNSNVSVVDTWWQTETGAHMITPLPGATPMKPGSATLPFFGVEPAILDDKGNEVEGPGQGYLVIKRPWPSMMRTVAGDHPRFEQTYFSHYKGYYFTGDGARRDEDGYYWILGRVDDVINVSGHRIGTAEVESALVGHHLCAEAAVVPVDHPIKGQAIYAFVTLMNGIEYPPDESVRKELVAQVRKAIGPIATPDVIHWAPGLPKTRSGKIMRRVLRKIASKEEDQLGDTSTLADPGVVQVLLELRGK